MPERESEPLFDSHEGYGSMDVAAAAGLAYQTLHRWTVAGAVQPSIQGADGTGTRRIWNEHDRQALTDIAAIAEDLHTLELDISIELVTRLWDACHNDPDTDVIELDAGAITITVDRRERRELARRALVHRGLEDE